MIFPSKENLISFEHFTEMLRKFVLRGHYSSLAVLPRQKSTLNHQASGQCGESQGKLLGLDTRDQKIFIKHFILPKQAIVCSI